MPFYYLTANKTREVFHNSEPLSLLRLKNSWREALTSVDLLKITLLHILFAYFYNGVIFREAYIRNYFCVSGFIYGEAYIRGVFSFTSTFYTKMNKNFNSAMVVIVWVLGTVLVKQHLKRLSSFELFYVESLSQFKNLSSYRYRYYL